MKVKDLIEILRVCDRESEVIRPTGELLEEAFPAEGQVVVCTSEEYLMEMALNAG